MVDHPKQYFRTIEQLYSKRFNAFLSTANNHVFNHNYAVDCVHDAFAKAQEYRLKHPDRNFREQIMHVLVIRAARKYNKRFGAEIPVGTFSDDHDQLNGEENNG